MLLLLEYLVWIMTRRNKRLSCVFGSSNGATTAILLIMTFFQFKVSEHPVGVELARHEDLK